MDLQPPLVASQVQLCPKILLLCVNERAAVAVVVAAMVASMVELAGHSIHLVATKLNALVLLVLARMAMVKMVLLQNFEPIL